MKLTSRKAISAAVVPLLLSLAGNAGATVFHPIALGTNSYNADIVVEASATGLMRNTTGTTDGGTNNNGNTWYEIGYNTNSLTSGVPLHNTTFVGIQTVYDGPNGSSTPTGTTAPSGTYTYGMAPSYTAPNAILIDTVITTNFVTMTSPAAYGALTFLVASGNGGSLINYTVFHADSTTESGTVACSDWFGNSNPAFIAYGRVATTSGGFDTQGSITSPGNPRWYGRDITLSNTASAVTGIGFGYNSGGAGVHNQVYAVSGAATSVGPFTPVVFTGYNYDVIVEADGTRAGRALCTTGVNTGADATTESIDVPAGLTNANTANSYCEMGYFPLQPLVGIPLHGATVTNAAGDHIFTMPPDYTTNDAVYLANEPGWSNVTVNFETPAAYAGLSFLYGAGNGGGPVYVQVHFQGGSSEVDTFTALDWFNGANVFEFCNGRVAVDTMTENNMNFPYSTNGDPVLHNADFALTDTKDDVLSVTLTYTNPPANNTALGIFAISGAQGATSPILNGGATLTIPGLIINADIGGSAQLSVAAPGGTQPLTLQWQADGGTGVFANLTDGADVTGSQTTNMVLQNLTLAQNEYFQLIVSNVAGSVTTAPVPLIVLSPLQDICTAGDPITLLPAPNAGSTPSGQAVQYAIDHQVGSGNKYLNFGLNGGQPFKGPIGFITTPSLGLTFVNGVRLYCADDTAGPGGRDPADFELFGSNDGHTWTPIYQNLAVNMPVGRNSGTAGGIIPEADYLQQYLFANSTSYAQYMWTVTNVQSDANNNSMQIGEVELLGTQDLSGHPAVSITSPAVAYNGSSFAFVATATGTPVPTLRWQTDGNTGVFTNLTDQGSFSGSATANLTINPADYANAWNYRAIASNSVGTATSSVVPLTILTTLPDVCTPGDVTATFGDSGLGSGNSANGGLDTSVDAIDGNTTIYINNGSGPNAGAGFVPFGGPVGFTVIPSAGTGSTPTSTLVRGIRIFSGQNTSDDDPADVELYGSVNGGTNWHLIVSTSLNLPDARTPAAVAVNPLTQPMQEILFANDLPYTEYKVQFTNVKLASGANSMQLAEVQLLGTQGPRLSTLSAVSGGTGTLTITSDESGELWSATALNGTWTDAGPITAGVGVVINITPAQTAVFYRVVAP
jgi:hypothetical protein